MRAVKARDQLRVSVAGVLALRRKSHSERMKARLDEKLAVEKAALAGAEAEAEQEAEADAAAGDVVRSTVGAAAIDTLKDKSPAERRPVLSCFAKPSTRVTRAAVSAQLGKEISKAEWAKAAQHSFWPGVGEPVPHTVLERSRAPRAELERVLRLLSDPAVFQRTLSASESLSP